MLSAKALGHIFCFC